MLKLVRYAMLFLKVYMIAFVYNKNILTFSAIHSFPNFSINNFALIV